MPIAMSWVVMAFFFLIVGGMDLPGVVGSVRFRFRLGALRNVICLVLFSLLPCPFVATNLVVPLWYIPTLQPNQHPLFPQLTPFLGPIASAYIYYLV
jgi:hypothetical protein